MHKLIALALTIALLLSGCFTGEKVRMHIVEGMPKADVIKVLGNPDGYKRTEHNEALLYINRFISGWGWDKADYTVILEDGKVKEWGAGNVRQAPAPQGGGFILFIAR
jgi:hypothetical protein